jgi:hypothetical protein
MPFYLLSRLPQEAPLVRGEPDQMPAHFHHHHATELADVQPGELGGVVAGGKMSATIT